MVGLFPPGGEDDDRDVAALAEEAADLVAVEVGQADIEQDDVGFGSGERRRSCFHPLDFKPLALEPLGKWVPDAVVVLDDEEAHGPTVAHLSPGVQLPTGRERHSAMPLPRFARLPPPGPPVLTESWLEGVGPDDETRLGKPVSLGRTKENAFVTRKKVLAVAGVSALLSLSAALAVGANFGLLGLAGSYRPGPPMPVAAGPEFAVPPAPAEEVRSIDVPVTLPPGSRSAEDAGTGPVPPAPLPAADPPAPSAAAPGNCEEADD